MPGWSSRAATWTMTRRARPAASATAELAALRADLLDGLGIDRHGNAHAGSVTAGGRMSSTAEASLV